MPTDRRQFLKGLGSFGFSAAAFGLVSGCNTIDLVGERQKIAVLLPLTGRSGGIGQSLERSAKLTAPKDDPFVELMVLDTKGDPSGAAAAAKKAVGGGAQMVLGPLFSNETQLAASAVGGRVPVIAYTNDSSQLNGQAFIFGLTPDQSVSAIFGYAKKQGLRRVAVVANPNQISDQAAQAAQSLAARHGIRITAIVPGGQGDLVAALRSSNGGKLPDAALLPDGTADTVRNAEELKGSGIKLLGTEQWLGGDLASRPAFNKAWFAAPVPSESFAKTFKEQKSAPAGILAGLVHDSINMARVLAVSGDMNDAGVMRAGGFTGAIGNFSFRADRGCDRSLSIVAIEDGRERVVSKG